MQNWKLSIIIFQIKDKNFGIWDWDYWLENKILDIFFYNDVFFGGTKTHLTIKTNPDSDLTILNLRPPGISECWDLILPLEVPLSSTGVIQNFSGKANEKTMKTNAD